MLIGKPVCVAPVGDRCGEGVMWCTEEGSVFWTDVLRFLIHRYEPMTGSVRTWIFAGPVVGLAPSNFPGVLVVALGSEVMLWDWARDRRLAQLFTLSGWPQVRLNEARADPLGNFWVGSMKNNVLPDGEIGETGTDQGVLLRIAPDLTVSTWRKGLGIANTMCWQVTRGLFYSGDTLSNEIREYDYDLSSGGIENERPFLSSFERGHPDGSAIDALGYLWNCRFGGACIVRVAPDGQVDQILEMPELNITSCCFGGSDMKSLYATTASFTRRPGDRLAGGLYRIDVDVAGAPSYPFNASQVMAR